MSYDRKYGRSPTFNFKNTSSIPADGIYLLDIESVSRTAQKYLPFNFVRIINQSGYDIEVYINQNDDNPVLIPKGTIQVIDKESAPAIRSFKIKNLDSTNAISANTVRLEVLQQGVTSDDVTNKVFRFFMKGKGNGGVVWVVIQNSIGKQ